MNIQIPMMQVGNSLPRQYPREMASPGDHPFSLLGRLPHLSKKIPFAGARAQWSADCHPTPKDSIVPISYFVAVEDYGEGVGNVGAQFLR